MHAHIPVMQRMLAHFIALARGGERHFFELLQCYCKADMSAIFLK